MTSHKFYKQKRDNGSHQKICRELIKEKDNYNERKGKFHKAATTIVKEEDTSSESSGLIASHAFNHFKFR